MKSICIVEDFLSDLFSRYSILLNGNYDVVVILKNIYLGLDPTGESKEVILSNQEDKNMLEKWAERGGHSINLGNVKVLQLPRGFYNDFNEILDENGIKEADTYFCDGLGGKCFHIADKMGKERTYIYSDSWEIQQKAKKENYNLVERQDLEELVR